MIARSMRELIDITNNIPSKTRLQESDEHSDSMQQLVDTVGTDYDIQSFASMLKYILSNNLRDLYNGFEVISQNSPEERDKVIKYVKQNGRAGLDIYGQAEADLFGYPRNEPGAVDELRRLGLDKNPELVKQALRIISSDYS